MLIKRGAAHFEMIIAFVMFVGFIFFLFTIIKPYDERKLSYAVLDGIFDSLKEQAQTNLTKVFLKANSPDSNCFYINFSKELFKYDMNNSRVFNISGQEVNSQLKENSLHLDKNQTFYYLYYSPDFNSNNVDCQVNVSDYVLGSIEEKRIISLKSLEQLKIEYFNDYLNLKKKMGVPQIYEFSIILEKSDIKLEGKISQTGDVLAKEYVTEVLNYTSGEIINAKILIKVW